MKKIRHSLSVPTLVLGVVLAALAVTPLMAQDWPMFGQNASNTASNTGVSISTSNINTLKTKWVVTTGGEVSARPAIVGNGVYFPDWAGNLYAVYANTGQVKWVHQFSDYGLAPGTVARSAPAVVGRTLYIGTQYNYAAAPGATGWMLAINTDTGNLIWKTQPDSNSSPVITASPVVDGETVYVGMTSDEEALAGYVPGYPCCSVRGSVVALDTRTGAKLWQTYMAPVGYSGANIWGGNPVADDSRNTLYVSTGDNYSHPTANAPSAIAGETFSQCLADPHGGSEAACLASNDYVDSIVALNMSTGAVKWSARMVNWNQPYEPTNGSDDWNVSCITAPYTNCPSSPTGPDYDFGSAPNEITYKTAHGSKTIIGAGQKSGIYYALDPDTGALLWQTQVGPGSSLGGMEWGSASDGQRIYVAISDFYGIPWAGGYAGGWVALDPATGNILWTTPDPNGAVDLGPLAVANGVVYAPSMAGGATQTNMYALNAANGNIVWSYASGGSVIAGAALVDTDVYWGSGYTHLPIPGFTTNNKLYNFSLNGR
jgi:polyvinyl alcohol dehydrogenase (cytochrome)